AAHDTRPAPGPAASPGSLVGLGLYDFLAAIVTGRAHVMPQMDFARGGFEGERTSLQSVVRATHVAPRRRLLVLLNGHVRKLLGYGPPGGTRRSWRDPCVPEDSDQSDIISALNRSMLVRFPCIRPWCSLRVVRATLQFPEADEG